MSHAISKAKARQRNERMSKFMRHAISEAKERKAAKSEGVSPGDARPVSHAISRAKARRVNPLQPAETSGGGVAQDGGPGSSQRRDVEGDFPPWRADQGGGGPGGKLASHAGPKGEVDHAKETEVSPVDAGAKEEEAKAIQSEKDVQTTKVAAPCEERPEGDKVTHSPTTVQKATDLRAVDDQCDALADDIGQRANRAGRYCALACTEFFKGIGLEVMNSVKECSGKAAAAAGAPAVDGGGPPTDDGTGSPPQAGCVPEATAAAGPGPYGNDVITACTDRGQVLCAAAYDSIDRKLHGLCNDGEDGGNAGGGLSINSTDVLQAAIEKGDELLYHLTGPCLAAANDIVETGDELIYNCTNPCVHVANNALEVGDELIYNCTDPCIPTANPASVLTKCTELLGESDSNTQRRTHRRDCQPVKKLAADASVPLTTTVKVTTTVTKPTKKPQSKGRKHAKK